MSVYFKDDPPDPNLNPFFFSDLAFPAQTKLYVSIHSSGWGVDIPGTWNGRPIDYYDYADQTFSAGDITVYSYSAPYDGSAHGIGVTVADGIENATILYSSVQGGPYSETGPTLTGVGTQTVWYEVSAPGYITLTNSATITISKKALTIMAAAKSKTYGAADPALTYTAAGLVGSDKVTGALTRDAGENVGAYAIRQGTLTAGNNYAISYTGANLTITKKTLTIKAAAKSKTYGAADPALTYTATGLVGSDKVTGALTRDAGQNVGAYAIRQGTLTAGNNYAISYTGANLTITKRSVTLTSASATKVYDGTPLTAGEVVVGGDGFAAGEGATYSFTGSQTAVGSSANAFTYALNSNTRAGNYTISLTEGTLTVTSGSLSSVFRFYSKRYRGHFFTINEAEKDELVANNPNWKYEGVAYRAFAEPSAGTVALHRFYSKNYQGHFFTIDEEEMWTVRLTNPNWKYEGVAYYVFPDAQEGTVPVFRFWSKGYRHHFYTINEAEKDELIATNPNWKYEGVAFWALPEEGSPEGLEGPESLESLESLECRESLESLESREGRGRLMVAAPAEWSLVALPGFEPVELEGGTVIGEFVVEACGEAPEADGAAILPQGEAEELPLLLTLPDGEWKAQLWNGGRGMLAEDDANGFFEFALPADGAWHWLGVLDAEGETVFAIWLMAGW